MKKFILLFSLILLGFLGNSAMGQANGNGNGNGNGNQFNPGSPNSPYSLQLVNQILHHASDDLNVPKGILLTAYFRGECTITFDFIIGAYLVSYGGGLSIVLVNDLS